MSTQETALAHVDPMMAALGIQEGEPMKPSNLRLLQPIETADEEGLIAGRYQDAQSNMQFEKLDVVVLQMQTGRVMYPPDSERGSKPLCRSRDGILPVIQEGLIRQDDGKGCANCNMGKWKKIGGRPIKPICRETMNMLVAEVDTEFVYRINQKGMALAPAKDLRETIRKSVMYAKSQGAVVPTFGLIYTMSAVKVKGPKGTYFIPKFTPNGVVKDNPEKLASFGQMFQHFVAGKGRNAASEEDVVEAAINNVIHDGQYESAPEYEQA